MLVAAAFVSYAGEHAECGCGFVVVCWWLRPLCRMQVSMLCVDFVVALLGVKTGQT